MSEPRCVYDPGRYRCGGELHVHQVPAAELCGAASRKERQRAGARQGGDSTVAFWLAYIGAMARLGLSRARAHRSAQEGGRRAAVGGSGVTAELGHQTVMRGWGMVKRGPIRSLNPWACGKRATAEPGSIALPAIGTPGEAPAQDKPQRPIPGEQPAGARDTGLGAARLRPAAELRPACVRHREAAAVLFRIRPPCGQPSGRWSALVSRRRQSDLAGGWSSSGSPGVNGRTAHIAAAAPRRIAAFRVACWRPMPIVRRPPTPPCRPAP